MRAFRRAAARRGAFAARAARAARALPHRGSVSLGAPPTGDHDAHDDGDDDCALCQWMEAHTQVEPGMSFTLPDGSVVELRSVIGAPR